MPQPTASDVHILVPETDFSIAYMQEDSAFVATQASAARPVRHKSNLYRIYDQGPFFRSEMKARAPGAESAGSGWTMSTQSYLCEDFALHHDLDDQTVANTDDDIDLDRDTSLYLSQQALIKLDEVWAATHFVTGVWTGSTTGTDLVGGTDFTQFSAGGSTPLEAIRAQIVQLGLQGVHRRNMVLVLGAQVWQILADHPEFVGRIAVDTTRIVTEDLVAALLGIGKVVVAAGVHNTGIEGGTDTNSYILGKSMLLLYKNPNPGPMQPTASVTFWWRNYLGGTKTAAIKKFRLNRNGADRIEIETAFDTRVTAPKLGVFFSAAVA